MSLHVFSTHGWLSWHIHVIPSNLENSHQTIMMSDRKRWRGSEILLRRREVSLVSSGGWPSAQSVASFFVFLISKRFSLLSSVDSKNSTCYASLSDREFLSLPLSLSLCACSSICLYHSLSLWVSRPLSVYPPCVRLSVPLYVVSVCIPVHHYVLSLPASHSLLLTRPLELACDLIILISRLANISADDSLGYLLSCAVWCIM